jgi:8-oxo-dGTP pyrophosphatase MutT (NUDIX family)
VAGTVEEARCRGAAGGQLTEVVRAAGGVVLRGGGDGADVLLVHRPRYDDWSFPKGKAEPGESDEECALREVEEETGLRCALGRELPSTTYTDPKGRPKVVRYWEMKVVDGELAFEHEVDAAQWVSVDEAADVLSYPRDVEVLQSATRTSA